MRNRTDSPSVTYRRAEPADAAALGAIARSAKAHWGYPVEWLDAWAPELTVAPRFLERHPAWVAEAEGEPVGFAAVRQTSGRCELEHLWVSPSAQGHGIGEELFSLAFKESRARGLPLVVESDPHAAGFYEHLGGQRIGVVLSEVLGTRRELPLFEFPSGR